MAGWVQSASDTVIVEPKEVDSREDTSTFVLARMWVRRNRAQIEMAMHRDNLDEYLSEQVSNSETVIQMLGRNVAAGGQ